jgi:magnesium chelatase family protein
MWRGKSAQTREISLAHLGILFLDEFPEFSREARGSLRQPLQDKKFTLTRAGQTFSFPAKCLVIPAQNYYPCGLFGAEGEVCRCTPSERSRYATALSEPLPERFDLFSDVPKLEYSEYANPLEINGKQIGELVLNVRKLSTRRNVKGVLNSELSYSQLADSIEGNTEIRSLIKSVVQKLHLSTRGLGSLLRMARTIADLEGSIEIAPSYIHEALQYRRRSVVQCNCTSG